jgi:glycosyltransferase involved in cell wall biosynthesis
MGTDVWAVSMVKDEADIVASTVGHMLTQVDRVLVADNGSTDGTRDILDGLACQVIDDPDPAYYQSDKMTRLAQLAREEGAEWVVCFDADEVWVSPFGRIADVLNDVPEEWLVCAATLYDHVATGHDIDHPDPTVRMKNRRPTPAGLPKVAARTASDLVIEQGNHGAHYTHRPAFLPGRLTVHHYPYRSREQFVRKVRNGAAAYAATNLPEDSGAHWRQYGAILAGQGEDACAAIFDEWFWQPTTHGLVYDPCP